MDATGRNNPAKNSDSFLKTTTWGALIALSLLAAAFGFRGSFSSSHSDSTEQIDARLESPQLPSVQSPAQPTQHGAYSGQQSRLSSRTLDQRRMSRVLAVNRSSVFSNVTPNLGAPNQSPAAAASSDNQD